MPAAVEERLQRDVGCPFCGLACDDLVVERAADALEIAANGCPLSRKRYAELQSASIGAPVIDGRAGDLPAAIRRAAEILGPSRSPVLVVAADVAGTRAALRIADRLGGVIDHPDSGALYAQRVLQDTGLLSTTLSELRNRADFVLVVGPDPGAFFPRFYERCIEPRQTLFAEGAPARALLRLGPTAQASPAAAATLLMEELPCAMERLIEAISAMRALLDDRPVASLDLPDLDVSKLNDVVTRLKAARYPVIVWTPALFDERDGALVAHALLELARAATRTTRCSLFPLGGSANLLGVNIVCTWQSGYPLRTSFGTGVPEHDPWRYSARRMLATGEADALVWISAFDTQHLPPETDVPTILLAPPGLPSPPRVAAYIPVGVPGLDHPAQVFRADAIVAVPLRALRPSMLPDVAAALGLIEARLDEGQA